MSYIWNLIQSGHSTNSYAFDKTCRRTGQLAWIALGGFLMTFLRNNLDKHKNVIYTFNMSFNMKVPTLDRPR